MLLPKAEARTVIDRFNVTDTGERSQSLGAIIIPSKPSRNVWLCVGGN